MGCPPEAHKSVEDLGNKVIMFRYRDLGKCLDHEDSDHIVGLI